MKIVQNHRQHGRLSATSAKERGGDSRRRAAKPRQTSEGAVLLPWRHYDQRLERKKRARRLPDHAPNFLVVAPPKTATTWLYEVFSADRRFFMPEKECRYFSHFWREYPLASYYAQFQNPFGALWRGEASPSYFMLPSPVIATIRDEIPDVKLIVLLRDPGERLWSHARHSFMYKEGWFRASNAWRIEEVSEAEWCHALLHPVIRAQEDYAAPLMRWAEPFPAEQLLILTSEMIGAEPERAIQEIYAFLGLEPPTLASRLLRNRPNPSPPAALPGSIAELLAVLAAASRSRLDALLPTLPARLADQLRSAMGYWRDTATAGAIPTVLPKPPGMPPRARWDELTTATFPRDLLSWSYNSLKPPQKPELLCLAALNFEYSYFSAPAKEAAPDETLLRSTQALGTSIIEHDARLSGIERTAATIQERLSGLERTLDQRIGDERLSRLEETIEERSVRLTAVERGIDEHSGRLGAIEGGDAARADRLARLEGTLDERNACLAEAERSIDEYRQRLGTLETGDAMRDRRLESLEATIEERTGRLLTVENRLDQQEQRTTAVDVSNDVRDERLSSLEATIEERTGRLLTVENRLDQQERRDGAIDAANEIRDERLSSLEATIEERTGRLRAVEGGITELHGRDAEARAELETARAEIQAQIALISTLRADQISEIEKLAYAVALLQDALQRVQNDLVELRLTRIETDFVSISGRPSTKLH